MRPVATSLAGRLVLPHPRITTDLRIAAAAGARMAALVTTPVANRPRFSWTGNVPGAGGFVEVELESGVLATGLASWLAYLPAGSTSFQPPELPPQFNNVRSIDPQVLQDCHVTALSQSDLPWDQFRGGSRAAALLGHRPPARFGRQQA